MGWALVLLFAAARVAAQDQLIPPTFEFSFSNPGARSMGFGGAFAALADDATAAFANPAGLVQLTASEVSIEGRYWSYSTPYVAGGRLFGAPIGVGLDTSPGLRTERSSADLGGLSFLSVVYPKKRWAIAFYRHQLANYEFAGDTRGLFSGPWPGGISARRDWDLGKTTDFAIASYAVSGAYRVTDALSLGIGLSLFDGRLSAVLKQYGRPPGNYPTEIFAADLLHIAENVIVTGTLALDGTDLGVNAGFLWRFAERWRLGGFYREGPVFDLGIELRAGAAAASWLAAPGTLLAAVFQPLAFPDVVGLGMAYRSPGERLTVSFEWDRVQYADLIDSGGGEGLYLEDGDELHLGAEYVFLASRRVAALRLGVWRDPDHQVRYRGENYVAEGVLRGGDDELHFAAGLGFVLEKVQIDLGVDLSDPVDTVSLSTIYSF